MNELVHEVRRMVPGLSRNMAVVYILRLRSGAYYVGASLDLEERLVTHATGLACRTTKLDAVVAVLRVEIFATFTDARGRETQVKKWSRGKKEALVNGDFDQLRKLSRSRE